MRHLATAAFGLLSIGTMLGTSAHAEIFRSPTHNFINKGGFKLSDCIAEDLDKDGGELDVSNRGSENTYYDFCQAESIRILNKAMSQGKSPNFANKYVLVEYQVTGLRTTQSNLRYYYAAVNPTTKYVAIMPMSVTWLGRGKIPLQYSKGKNSLCTTHTPPENIPMDLRYPQLTMQNHDVRTHMFSRTGEPSCVYLKENSKGQPYWEWDDGYS